jgi:uncharacterized membrane protein YfcA
MPSVSICILVGFVAQLIDGALGMAYGVSCTTFLMTFGLTPAMASASVKTSEVFTTAVSGLSHLRLGNVDRQLFLKLCLPGIIGGVIGAFVLTHLSGEKMKRYVAGYLFLMGIVIVAKAWKSAFKLAVTRDKPIVLAFVGGLLDAIGGGGWGPIVTTTLIARGHEPRTAIGSVNLAEFFVTAAQMVTFTAFLGLKNLNIVIGLVLGGIIAAPLAAYVCRKLPPRLLMILVGSLIILLSLRILVSELWQ